jgi:hypothetical protein
MKIFTFVRRQMVPLVVLGCFAFFDSPSAHATTCATVLSGSIGASDTVTVLLLRATLASSIGTDMCTSLEATKAQALGFNVEIDSDTAWEAKTQAQFATYRAIVLGDANCPNQNGGAVLDSPVTAAKTNKAWQAATTGPVAVVGTDPVFHVRNGSGPMGALLTQNAIALAASIPGKPGAYISLSCYYLNSGPGTAVDVLSPQFGTFTVVGSNERSTNNVTISSPSNALVTTPNTLTDAGLSNWGESVHEAFDSALPSGFSAVVNSLDLHLPYIITGQVQVQTLPPQTVSAGGTNILQFVTTANNLVQHNLIWPGTLQFNNGVSNPQLLSSNIILSTTNGIRQYLAFTPWAVAQLFEKPGDNQAANGTGFGSLYRDKCFQSGQDLSTATEQNCPIGANPNDFINLSDIFDQPTPKKDIAPGTTVSLVHHFTTTSDVWSPVPSGATSNPACMQVATVGATFNCELEDDLTYDPASFATFPGGVSGDQTTIGGRKGGRGTIGSLFNVPMLQTAVKVNNRAVNTILPEVQGTQQYWFNSHTLNLDFLVNPPPTPLPPNNGWVAAPPSTLAYVFFSNSISEPALPSPPSCPSATEPICNVVSGVPGQAPAAPVEFSSTQTVGTDGRYTLAWSARDTVSIGERNIQLLHSLPIEGTCPNPYRMTPAPTPPCYSTTLFNAQIGVDTVSPTITTNPSGSFSAVLNGPAPTLNFSCADPLSGIQVCGTSPSTSVLNPGAPSFAGSAPQSTTTLGSTTITVYAQDVAGNKASTPVKYSVLYSTGSCLGQPAHQILPPIDPAGTSVFKKGRSVPARFRLCDANGVSISTPGVITNITLQMKGGTDGDAPEDVADQLEDTNFHFDAENQWWICNIRTRELERGFTYAYTLTLNDGSTLQFQFGLK